MKRRDLLKSVGAATGFLLGGLWNLSGISAQAQPATPEDAEPVRDEIANEDIHPAHWDDVYNCPRCGIRCDNDHNCIASTTPQHVGYDGQMEWDETIQCKSCGEIWDVEDAGG